MVKFLERLLNLFDVVVYSKITGIIIYRATAHKILLICKLPTAVPNSFFSTLLYSKKYYKKVPGTGEWKCDEFFIELRSQPTGSQSRVSWIRYILLKNIHNCFCYFFREIRQVKICELCCVRGAQLHTWVKFSRDVCKMGSKSCCYRAAEWTWNQLFVRIRYGLHTMTPQRDFFGEIIVSGRIKN